MLCNLSSLKGTSLQVVSVFNTFEREVLICLVLRMDGYCNWDEEESYAKRKAKPANTGRIWNISIPVLFSITCCCVCGQECMTVCVEINTVQNEEAGEHTVCVISLPLFISCVSLICTGWKGGSREIHLKARHIHQTLITLSHPALETNHPAGLWSPRKDDGWYNKWRETWKPLFFFFFLLCLKSASAKHHLVSTLRYLLKVSVFFITWAIFFILSSMIKIKMFCCTRQRKI